VDVPATTVDWRSKGFWLPDGERAASWYATTRPGLFEGGFTWPVMVLRQSAAHANIATMAEYCRRHGVEFAPHAKTSMASGLIARQLAAGAWGMTVATPNQALVLYRLGAPRVFIANEVLDPVALEWLATVSGFEACLQVDSLEGVAAAAAVPSGRLRIFVEVGHADGRTGVRSPEELSAVAAAVHAAPRLSLVGVTGYEGQLKDVASVDAFLDGMVAGVSRLREEGVLPAEPWVSAGGSAWFDRVIARLAGLRVLMRSGASVSHDDGYPPRGR
jgi:D-serine deaminase-like pyridoxal phosphate-dependent protein